MSLDSEINEQGILWFKSGDYEKAKKCWEISSEQGNSSSMFCMGVLYLSTKYYDLTLARNWFEKAYMLGHKNAKYQLDHLNDGMIRTDLANKIFCQPTNVYADSNWLVKKFGNYEWFVIESQPQKKLYISKYIIDIRKYHNSDTSISWEKSDIRKWLNTDFYNEFSIYEKQLICDTYNINRNNPKYCTSGGDNTLDKCFLLSYEEVKNYMLRNIDICETPDLLSTSDSFSLLIALVDMSLTRISVAQERTGLDYSMINGKSLGWWLRTPGVTENKAIRISCKGAIRLHGREIDRNLVGVRPAIWVKNYE